MNLNDGTQRKLCKISESDAQIAPTWVTNIVEPFGSVIDRELDKIMELKNEVESSIWSVAPVSTIQESDGMEI